MTDQTSRDVSGNVPMSPDLVLADTAATWPDDEFDTRGSRLRDGIGEWWPYYAMLAPGLIYFAVFHYLPIWEAKLAFEDLRIIGPNVWVGLKHFAHLDARETRAVIADPGFRIVLLRRDNILASTRRSAS